MKATTLFPLFTAIVLFSACRETSVKKTTGSKISISSLTIEKIALDSIDNCSYIGFSSIRGDSVFYFDEVLSYLYSISLDGHIGERQLGLGKSASELPIKNPMQVCYSKEDDAFNIMGSSYDLYTYYPADRKTHRINMKPTGTDDSFQSSTAYTLWDEVLLEGNNDYIYYNIFGNNEKVDIFNRSDYIDKAALLMKVSKETGEMTPIGSYSDYYKTNKNKIKHMPRYYFDIDDEGGFYFTFQVDSIIYHYDKDFNLIESFGLQGRNMNTKLSDPGSTTESFVKAFMADKDNVGHYYWIKNCKDYVFRSYFKSNKSNTDGLQIYKDGILIGDVDVPKNFRVSGYTGSYFVTNISFKESPASMTFYRFKLK